MATSLGCSTHEEIRSIGKSPTFHPTLWGDFFLTHQLPSAAQQACMKERAEVLREEVRRIIKDARELPEILNLIITLQRLGVEYHYESEIDKLLCFVHNSDYDKSNLDLVSLRFYLLRKNGYRVSSDVFLNFKDKEGNFIDADIRGLLSLYNAAHLRIHGEKVLDEAIIFTRNYLESALQHLESPLEQEVSSALETPLFRRVRRLETINYISIYEKEATRNEVILEFAKLDFNLLQLLYCEELKSITLWWKELNVTSKLNFVRDRIVEMYFWMNGACFEPQYALSRLILTKMTAIITIVDDIMDTYGTTEESRLLNEAIQRWDESETASLPEYIKDFYMFLLKTVDSFENELGPENDYRVFYLKESFKRLVQAYFDELTWRDENYVPKTLKEHLQLSMRSSGAFPLGCASFVGMGDEATKETFEWVLSYPKFLKSFDMFVRLSNDIASTKREQTAEHSVSTIQCFMEEHGTTMQDARQKIKELIEETWKDMIEHCVTPTEQPMTVLQMIINLARTGDYMYKHIDAFTDSHILKEMITFLLVEPIAV